MFKCKLWNYRCVLLCHAFHGLCGFLVGLAYLQTDLSVISFGSWMFAKSPVTVVSSLEKKAIQIHSVRIKLYYILWLHSLLKWMLTKYLTYFPFLFLSTSYSGQAAVNARLFFFFFFFFLQRFPFNCFCFFWSLCLDFIWLRGCHGSSKQKLMNTNLW